MILKELSPLRYPGGKAKILNFIIKVVEANDFKNRPYVEPYAGGAGVALGLLVGGYVANIHINDIDPGIYALWKNIVNRTDQFIDKIHNTEISIQEWHKQREIYFNQLNCNEFERGFATFYLNRCNRSGILTGGCIGGKNQDGKYKLDARFNKKTLIERIEKIALFKDKIEIYNQDTVNLLKKNKRKFKKAILYLDPPYYEKGSCLYRNHYQHNDHVEICKIVQKLKGHWIVSYDNVPEIVDLYGSIPKREFSINYSIGQNRKGREVMFFSKKIMIPNNDIIIPGSIKC